MTIHDATDAHYFGRLLSLANLDIAAGSNNCSISSVELKTIMAAIKYLPAHQWD